MAKATHKGTCQICGHFQKLPGGTLSTHGYKVEWSMFTGVCTGTGALPYEVSTDLIAAAVTSATAAAVRLDAEAAALLADTDPQAAWQQERVAPHYEGARYIPGYYRWNLLDKASMDITRTESGGDAWYAFGPLSSRIIGDSAAAIMVKMNAKRAAHLQREAGQYRAYADWQQERINNWQPAGLTPLAK